MLLEQLRAKRQAIETLGQKFGAKRIRVFGSVARGEESDHSDIDFLVEFPRGYDLFQQRIRLTEELSLLLDFLLQRGTARRTEAKREGTRVFRIRFVEAIVE